MHRRTITVCLALSFVGLASFPGCSSKSGGFEDDDSGSSSSSSSSGSSSGSGSSTSSGSGTSSSSSSSGSSTSGGGIKDASLDGVSFTDSGTPYCNTTPCDLKSNTCCVTQFITGSSCIEHGQACPPMTAAFSCLQQSDCTTAGQVCCGAADSTAQTAQTACKAVSSGASPCGASTSTAAYAQICEQTSECKNAMQCIPQVCMVTISGIPVNADLTMCGLQSQAPFNCKAK